MFAKLFDTLANLPVNGIVVDVATKVLGGTVIIVASATGSGKTLLLPASLAVAGDHSIVVLVPRRFLAVNAAETVADLSDLTVGQEVGYAVGTQSGEESRRSADGKVLYCTYGYAIASNLILTAPVVVLDEVHEASLDMSICRALLHRRLAAGEQVRVLEMSATINAERQAAYWSQVAPAEVIAIDGRTFPCERLHRPAAKPVDAVQELLELGRMGILVFRPGRGEVEETAAAIRALVGEEVEVAEIYGELDYAARKAAVAAPEHGKAKVLVGTNVVESGANIPWLDAGVTCGTAKEISVRPETGATFLKLIELPRWRLDQQEGRVKRFRDGIFVLCAQLSYEAREAETTPEIRRLPLTELVMHCASFGIRAEELRFDYAPETARIVEAETKLQRLGLIDTNCRLTKAGRWVANMPVGPETGAMLWHAKTIGMLGAALPLAAVIEVDGVRKDFREPHGLDGTSDWLDALKAFQLAYSEKENWKRKALMESNNISYKRFQAAMEMLHDLRRRFNGEASSTLMATDEQLRHCLVAGFITNLFIGGFNMRPLAGDRYSSYSVGNGSAASYLRGGYALGQLRTIQPKNPRKGAFTVVEKVTDVSLDDILAVTMVRPSLITRDQQRVKVGFFSFQTVITWKLFGAYELQVEKQGSLLTLEEEAEKAAFEANRATLRQQLEALNPVREELGLGAVIFADEVFRLDYYSVYAYTADDVARAEEDNATALTNRRAELEAARLKAERIATLRPQFEALNRLRKEAGMSELELRDESVRIGWSVSYEYSEETLAKFTAELEAHKATQQAENERVAREAAEALVRAEAEEAARREEESQRQQAMVAAGKARIEKLNRRREALGWQALIMRDEGYEIDGFYLEFIDDVGFQQMLQEVIAEERKRADEAKRAESALPDRDTLAAMLGSRFAVSRR